MARYLLHHRHQPHECSIVFTSFKAPKPASPPRDVRLLFSGRREIWWAVQAEAGADAPRLLSFYVAAHHRHTR